MNNLVILLIIVFCISCRDSETFNLEYSIEGQKKEYIFGVHPLHNPERLHQVFSPLINLINKRLVNEYIVLEASKSYADYDQKMLNGHFDISLPNPYQTLMAIEHGYTVFAKMGDDFNFKGIFVARKDSPIKSFKDLIEKQICFPAPTALAATMMPQWFLYQHGIDIKKDIKVRYVGSQESSIIGAFNKTCIVSATWPLPWEALKKERPQIAEELEVIWNTKPLINNGLVYKNSTPHELVEIIKDVIFNLPNSDEGRAILQKMELSKFEKASNETYKVINQFIAEFTKNVRKPSEK